MNANMKYKRNIFGGGWGTRVSELFLPKNPDLFFFFFGGGGGGG